MKLAPRCSTSAIMLAVLTIGAASCRGQKAEQASIPVPVNPSPPPRPVRPLPDSAFQVEWVKQDVPGVVKAGAGVHATVTLRNISIAPWPDPDATSQEPPVYGAVRLTYRWWPASPPTPSAWGARADLHRVLQPGQAVTLGLTVEAPATPGDYRLQFDLVQEMAAFFNDKGASPLFVPVQVR